MIEKRGVAIRRLLTLAGVVALVSAGACDESMTGLVEETVATLEAEGKIDGESAEVLPKLFVRWGPDVDPDARPPLIFVGWERIENPKNIPVNPDDIERVEVLKGEAAEKLYGEEGAHGVIQIYTKSAGDPGGTP